MLLIRCAGCKRKLWKYEKIGKGAVLRCYKDRITRAYYLESRQSRIICACGKEIGNDKGDHIRMITGTFTYSGTKKSK